MRELLFDPADTGLDDLLDVAVAEGLLASGRDPALAGRQMGTAKVIAAGTANGRADGYHPGLANQWTAEDDAALAAWAGELGLADIAARLNRTPLAVKVRITRAGLPMPTNHPDYLTAHRAARALGVDVHAVCKLIERGILPAELTPTAERMIYRISRQVFYVWATRPENWVYFIRSVRNPERIRDEKLRRLIARRAETWLAPDGRPDEWWTTGEVARYHGVDSKDVERYIMAGRLPAVKWGNWLVKRSDVTRPGLRFFKDRGGATFDRNGTAAGDAFIVLAVAVGVPAAQITRMLGRGSNGLVQSRYAAICRRGLVRPLIRAFNLPVYTRDEGSRTLTWADWETSGRFPAVGRALGRFDHGERLDTGQRYLLAGVFRSAAEWSGDSRTAAALRRGVAGTEILADARRLYGHVARQYR